ncbi:hypothetical protein GLW03_12960 [Halobacillus halophilus]|uniref:hypothetical protein n=1 Tax=Halobacillus halophilus TaxID=1570 RepID=UPI0013718627|nr:hypothetical protein [Halobacillus halophilus]MYL30736.1 hypothetical protein [Halobacillus halophilus]
MKYAVRIESKFIEPRGEERMTPKELFLFAHLKSRVSFLGELDTNLDLLSCFVKFKARKSDNKKEIRSLLTSLVEKGVVNVEQHEGFMKITFPTQVGNYDLFPMEILEKAMNHQEFILMVYIFRFQSMNGDCVLAYSRIGELLEVSRPKAVEIVEDLTMRGLIHKHVGERVDSKRQEMNTYKLTFVKEAKDIVRTEQEAADPQETPHEPSNTQNPQEPSSVVSERPDNVVEFEGKKNKAPQEPSQADLWKRQEEAAQEEKKAKKVTSQIEKPQEPDYSSMSPTLARLKRKAYEGELKKYEQEMRAFKNQEQNEQIEKVF